MAKLNEHIARAANKEDRVKGRFWEGRFKGWLGNGEGWLGTPIISQIILAHSWSSPLFTVKTEGDSMAIPRSKYVTDCEIGAYHCVSRCVRRAFLCGQDAVTGKDFSHRKNWIVDRLRFLASIFAIEVCCYSVMENHSHEILRTRPDIVAIWSDNEVAAHWLMLCPQKCRNKGAPIPSLEEQIQALASCSERIAVLRKRLSNISWFMAKLNEHIARAANKEDRVKGRFWEGRFKCQALLDEAAIAACMSYVDLNPIRAGIAATPEKSDFTSIQERIRTWHKEQNVSVPNETSPINAEIQVLKDTVNASNPKDCWLCPIQSNAHRRGILQMTEAEYFDLVDRSGRMVRSDKRGSMDPKLAPILIRIGAIPETWSETVSSFKSIFRLAAGHPENLRKFANKIGSHWLKGVRAARSAFSLSLQKI
jgi:REP element-mobilizing transposase RayT